MAEVADRRRALQVSLGLGAAMLARGAQVVEVEAAIGAAAAGLGLPDPQVAVGVGTVSVSVISPGDAEPLTAIATVGSIVPDFARLEQLVAVVGQVAAGCLDAPDAAAELARVEQDAARFPRWVMFAAPALLSFFVTFLFAGSAGDAVTTLLIGLLLQPILVGIERWGLPAFFQVAFGVSATTLIVVLLVRAGLPIAGGLVLTGSLLRFLPGAQLVAGMSDLIAGSVLPGVANLAQVALLGASVAGAASLMLAVGEGIGVSLGITAEGGRAWPAVLVVAAGAAAVVMSGVRSNVPLGRLFSVGALGAVTVMIARGFLPGLGDWEVSARVLCAALVVGAGGAVLAHRGSSTSGLWTVPAVLPLLPAPATLLPLLATSEAVQDSLQGQALATAFAIGVGVASGSIAVSAWLRYRDRILPRARRAAPPGGADRA